MFLGSSGTFIGKANYLSKTRYQTLGQQKIHVGSLKYCCDRSFAGLKYTTLIFAGEGLYWHNVMNNNLICMKIGTYVDSHMYHNIRCLFAPKSPNDHKFLG